MADTIELDSYRPFACSECSKSFTRSVGLALQSTFLVYVLISAGKPPKTQASKYDLAYAARQNLFLGL
jgi:hypothetical protein